MRGGAQVKREGKPRAEDAAGMAALLEDLRPVLDAYRCGTHATGARPLIPGVRRTGAGADTPRGRFWA